MLNQFSQNVDSLCLSDWGGVTLAPPPPLLWGGVPKP